MMAMRATPENRTTGVKKSCVIGCAVLLVIGLRGKLGLGGEPTEAVFYGYASPEPAKWEHKPVSAVEVSVCGSVAPPKIGTVVTVVPPSATLPAKALRVVKKAGKRCAFVEQIKDRGWVEGSWSEGGAWAYPRVLALRGDMPNARAVDPTKLSGVGLPPGTASGDVRLAIDIDGDGHVDAITRSTCIGGGRDCEDPLCQETWMRAGDRWSLEVRICAD
jgi:hypothetical protein